MYPTLQGLNLHFAYGFKSKARFTLCDFLYSAYWASYSFILYRCIKIYCIGEPGNTCVLRCFNNYILHYVKICLTKYNYIVNRVAQDLGLCSPIYLRCLEHFKMYFCLKQGRFFTMSMEVLDFSMRIQLFAYVSVHP